MHEYEKIALTALETLLSKDLTDKEKEEIYQELILQKKYIDNIMKDEEKLRKFLSYE